MSQDCQNELLCKAVILRHQRGMRTGWTALQGSGY